MRPYEVMIILDAGLEEDSIQAVLDKTDEILRANGGNPGRVERWGRRRFAYELDHKWEGYYVLVEATAEPTAVAELDRALRLSDDVLRHKVIRLPDDVAGRQRRPAAPSEQEETAEAGTPANGA